MKAISMFEYGKPPVLTDLPVPTITGDEVLVKVTSTAVNHLDQAARYGVIRLMMNLAPSADDLGRIARLLEEGKLRADVASVYALEDTATAWDSMAGGSASAGARRGHGKVVLRVA